MPQPHSSQRALRAAVVLCALSAACSTRVPLEDGPPPRDSAVHVAFHEKTAYSNGRDQVEVSSLIGRIDRTARDTAWVEVANATLWEGSRTRALTGAVVPVAWASDAVTVQLINRDAGARDRLVVAGVLSSAALFVYALYTFPWN